MTLPYTWIQVNYIRICRILSSIVNPGLQNEALQSDMRGQIQNIPRFSSVLEEAAETTCWPSWDQKSYTVTARISR